MFLTPVDGWHYDGGMLFRIAVGLGMMLNVSGCSILIGNIKPSTEKSSAYTFQPPPQADSDWIAVDAKAPLKGDEKAGDKLEEASDLVFQSKSTANIISLNSTCRDRDDVQINDLRAYTQLLLMGVQNMTDRVEKPLTIDKVEALETSVKGTLQNQAMEFQTVVTRRGNCVYDLMYIAQARHFAAKQASFAEFVKSLHFKD